MHDQHQNPLPDIQIAQNARMLSIAEVAHRKLELNLHDLLLYGHFKAKVSLDRLNTLQRRPNSKLILVTAITPTAAGEGKTTTTVGLGDALNHIGKRAIVCLREPSLGPCFGMKGGAAGGGYAQVLPMEDINLHFTGDFHAIGAANNLLAALVDNHIYWGNELSLDARRLSWRRAVDMNDRSLRETAIALGSIGNGFPRQDGWDIIAASEIMAVFCLAESIDDLKRRLGNIIVGQTRDRKYVHASDLEAAGAMTALLKDAFAPNLVQTIENNPALIHGGPFANIAHGCNSVVATKSALKLADYVVTEAGFGADLGAEKFMDIKCRKAGLAPDCVVLVATIRALKMHGGASKEGLKQENLDALEKGFENLSQHVQNIRKFGVPTIVAINRFSADTEVESALLRSLCQKIEVESITTDHWAKGGEGATALAEAVLNIVETTPSQFRPLYTDETPLWRKTQTIAREMYGADDIIGDQKIRDRFGELQDQGYGHFPVCVAKTQYSFSTDPDRKGAPKHHVLPIREVRLSAGAEFIVAICGDIMTMPGLPRIPAANKIDVTTDGRILGLF
jgi:formate--tetrahydrofolate ligase